MPTRVRLFGPLQVLVDGGWVRPPPQKTSCLLGYLAFQGDWVLRERLALLFWPDADGAAARRNLRQLLQRARRTGLADELELEPDRVRWRVPSDVAAFRQAIADGDWGAAVPLYQGPLLDGLPPPGCGGFEDWVAMEREAMRDAWRDAAHRGALALAEHGRTDQAVDSFQRLLDDDPLAEDVVQAYLRSAGAAGKRSAALRTFARFARRLEDELGLAPMPETVALVEALERAHDGAGAATDGVGAPWSQAGRTGRPSFQTPDLAPARLIGRDDAIDALQRAPGPLTWLVGDAGVGKSAVLQALAPSAPRVACREPLQGVPFGALVPFAREAGTALGATARFRGELAPILPEAATEAGVALEGSARKRLLHALVALIEERAAPSGGIGLVVDDAQWADDATLEVLALLAERGTVRAVVAFRDHEVAASLAQLLRRFPAAEQVRLEPLDDDGVVALLGELMGRAGGPPLFGRWLKRVTGGNPLFVLETLRTLFEEGDLRVEDGRWRSRVDHVTRDYGELRVPVVVDDTVRRRLDRLGDGPTRVLQALAVAGGRLSLETLAAVSGVSVWAAADALEAAERAGLLRKDAMARGDALEAFAHDLVRRAIYQGVPAMRKRLLHARFAQAADGRAPDARTAEHWLAAGEPVRALRAFEDAAHEVRRRGLHDDALTLLARARGLADGATDRDRLDGLRIRTLREAGRIPEAVDEARALLAREGASLQAQGQAYDVLALAAVVQQDLDGAREAAASGLAAARGSGDAALVLQLVSTQAVVAYTDGSFREALTLLEPLLKDGGSWRDSAQGAFTLSNVAALYDALGRSEEALPLHLDALATARRHGAHREQVDIVTNLLYCCLELRRPSLGVVAAHEALALGRFEGSDGLRLNLASALVDLGRADDAAAHYRIVAETGWDPSYQALAWARLAAIEAENGAEALPELDRALTLATGPLSPIVLARVAIVGARHGGPSHRDAAAEVAARVAKNDLPEYLRHEFERTFGPEGVA